jgi:hypothetical protein
VPAPTLPTPPLLLPMLLNASKVAFGCAYEHTTNPLGRICMFFESPPCKTALIDDVSIGAYITYDPTGDVKLSCKITA